ncbi:MAG: hypothetical protein EOP24_42360 [Hyphomicrobiales bacterium]|nr:MAG: hypothetical protein EOP24_42360 [Hyphomicrobiales bacterium]
MAKKDIAVTISAADRLLETLANPLHRRIIENYRRHAILEVCGEWEQIFDPEMTVPHPIYYFNIAGWDGVKAEGDEVRAIYRNMSDTNTTAIVVEDEQLMVADWGFASNSIFNSFKRGEDLIDIGITDVDPEGYYNHRQHFAMIWPYDERGRMIGEHVYENRAYGEVIEVPVEDYVTIDDARARLRPLLKPLSPMGTGLVTT